MHIWVACQSLSLNSKLAILHLTQVLQAPEDASRKAFEDGSCETPADLAQGNGHFAVARLIRAHLEEQRKSHSS